MDNRITIAVLLLLLALSSSHLAFSKRFQLPPAKRSQDLGLFLPRPFAQGTAQAVQSAAESAELLKLGLTMVKVGSNVLYKNRLGCLYTRRQLNRILNRPDRYRAEMRKFLNR